MFHALAPSSQPSNGFHFPLLTSRSTTAIFLPIPIIRSSPSPVFSPPAGTIPREQKRRSALSQHRFTFLSHSVCSVRKQDWCLWASSGVPAQTKTPSKSGKITETVNCCNHVLVFPWWLVLFFLITYLCIYYRCSMCVNSVTCCFISCFLFAGKQRLFELGRF